MQASNTGMVVLGGGVVKHHIFNANLMVCTFMALNEQKDGLT
jgi:deoxyhypusine synthase